ncbi:siphovirus Gp157 family protein [Ursidibacter arcticus]
MKLYDLNESYQNLLELLDNEEFQDNEDIINALETIKEEFSEKADNVVRLIKNAEAEATAIAPELKRLTARKQARENLAKRLKQYLLENMTEQKIKTNLFTISVAKTQAVDVQVPVNNLPLAYQKISIEPNKTELKKAIKAGEVIEGVSLIDSPYLAIR